VGKWSTKKNRVLLQLTNTNKNDMTCCPHTLSHELEASGSSDWILLSVVPGLAASTRARERVLSMLSPSSSNRIAAIVESNFMDCTERSIKLQFLNKFFYFKFQIENFNI
jgi:hypothetical protein